MILLNKAHQTHTILHRTLIQYIFKHPPTPPSPSEIQTSTYTPAQTNPVQTTQPTLNIHTIHSNPSFNYTTARHLSRPPLQTILTNPLSYSLTSTNPSHTQHYYRYPDKLQHTQPIKYSFFSTYI